MRVFASIELPESVKENILDASKYFNFKGVTTVKADALHVTLEFFGEIDDGRVKEIEQAMDSIRTGPFEVTLKAIGFFSPHRMRVVYVGVSSGADEVTGIHDSLAKALGIRDEQEFVPHVTIGRITYLKERNAFLELATGYEETEFGTFTVDSISLKKSTLTREGPVYETLHESKL